MRIPTGPRRKILSQIAAWQNVPAPKPSGFIRWDKGYKPYTVIKGLLKPEEADQVRAFIAGTASDMGLQGTDYDKMLLGARIHLPRIEAKLEELYPDMMVFSSHFFSGTGEKPGAIYSGWHTGCNLSKTFVGYPETFTVWMPLQTLTEKNWWPSLVLYWRVFGFCD
jgi:hypothetical protein